MTGILLFFLRWLSISNHKTIKHLNLSKELQTFDKMEFDLYFPQVINLILEVSDDFNAISSVFQSRLGLLCKEDFGFALNSYFFLKVLKRNHTLQCILIIALLILSI